MCAIGLLLNYDHVIELFSTICSQYDSSSKNTNILSDHSHLVPKFHPTVLVPEANVSIYEEQREGEQDGEYLSREPHVVAGQEGQCQHSIQDKKDLQSRFPSWEEVQVGLAVLLTVL